MRRVTGRSSLPFETLPTALQDLNRFLMSVGSKSILKFFRKSQIKQELIVFKKQSTGGAYPNEPYTREEVTKQGEILRKLHDHLSRFDYKGQPSPQREEGFRLNGLRVLWTGRNESCPLGGVPGFCQE